MMKDAEEVPGIVASKAGLKHAGETPTLQVKYNLVLPSMWAEHYVFHCVTWHYGRWKSRSLNA